MMQLQAVKPFFNFARETDLCYIHFTATAWKGHRTCFRYGVFPHKILWGSCFWICTPRAIPPPRPPPRPPLCHTHTQLCHTQLCHIHNFVTHTTLNFVTHTTLSHSTYLNFVTYNFVTLNFVTYNFVTHHFVTHNFVTYKLSHTTSFHVAGVVLLGLGWLW